MPSEGRWPTPLILVRQFAKGNWINMLAAKYDISETAVEVLLMKAVAKLLRRKA